MRGSLPGLVALALVAGCQPSQSGSPSPLVSVGAASASALAASPTPSPISQLPPQIVWSHEAFDGAVRAMTVDGDQLVAVGARADGPAAWTSHDGVIWDRHSVPPPGILDLYEQGVPGGDPQAYLDLVFMGPLARLGDTIFSFGTFAGDNDFVRPIGWRSANGSAWESIESQSAFFQRCCATLQLVSGDPGLLAVKHNFGEYTGEMWRWTAATSWVQTWPETSDAAALGAGEISDVTWADGRFVAVGVTATYDAPTDTWLSTASSWVSVDGTDWQVAAQPADLGDSVMQSVSASPAGGFVSVGCQGCAIHGRGTPAAWASVDGLVWTPAVLPSGFSGIVYRVLEVKGGLLAVATAPDGTATWTSADGIDWQAGPMLADKSDGVFLAFPEQTHNLVARDGEVLFVLYRGRDASGTLLDSILYRGAVGP